MTNKLEREFAEIKARQRLLDAAPELLELAELVLATACDTTPAELLRAARQAIAKAKGSK